MHIMHLCAGYADTCGSTSLPVISVVDVYVAHAYAYACVAHAYVMLACSIIDEHIMHAYMSIYVCIYFYIYDSSSYDKYEHFMIILWID